jgi:arginine/lysine/ornithine decarboxylase
MSIAAVIDSIEAERVNNAELGRKITAKIQSLVAANDALRAQVEAQGEELLRMIVAIEDEIVARDKALRALIDGPRVHAGN